MGICASCLGLNRHPSQDDIDETDPLLDEPGQSYGAVGTDGQVDEEELQREREELDRITNAATENMIDIHQPEAAELGPNAPSRNASQTFDDTNYREEESGEDAEEEDEEEAAWLESVQADDVTAIQGLQAGGLVLDIGQLRDKPSAATKSLKERVGV